MTIQELRRSGYKVGVYHDRVISYNNLTKIKTINPKGGHTRIIIDAPNGDHFEGEAVCSNEDNYNKKLGLRIALGRSGIWEYFAK